MGRIGDRFDELRQRGERALVSFLTAGDPDLETTEALVVCMAESGVDLIEIGVPFSDPIAEGPTIQRASERALRAGTSLRKILELVARVRERVDVPLTLMGYANPIHAMGPVPFAEAAAKVGVDGIIVPDLPPEEGDVFYKECRQRDIDPVLLAAPTTSDQRLQLLVERTRGFLYYVSVQGVTGSREQLALGIEERVKLARGFGDVPICVGFGISTPEHAARVGRYADGVVVGSAFVNVIEASTSRLEAVEAVAKLVRELKAPLR
jgi:tryptophan synthase alpha chain